MLTSRGDYVSVHFDARAKSEDYQKLRSDLADADNIIFARRRVRCGWGEWSLVQATLGALKEAFAAFADATHFYMLSGDCRPIKTSQYIHDYLDSRNVDVIENEDYFNSDWIKTGMKDERLIYRHYFNERKNKKLFYAALTVQKHLRLERALPADLEIRIGSQWWCLRRSTVEAVLDFIKQRRDVVRFFATTWIPDETFFQTLVPHLVPTSEIENRTLTFLMFTDYGMPVTFYNDHYDLLLSQDYLFARKISPEAADLKRRLGLLYAASDVQFKVSGEGPNLFRFLTGRGREGRRFAPRFWETEATLGRKRELLIIVCKKWHVAKRLLAEVRHLTNVAAVEYVFNEEETPLPDLGGIQSSLGKRTRHRRALMRMLFDYFDADRLLVCIDPSNIDLLQDFASDRSTTRILEIECQFSDDYLIGHAMRVGLAGERTSQETFERLLPTIRNDIIFESDRIRDAGFEHFAVIEETATPDKNADALAAFLSVASPVAKDIVSKDTLFSD